MSEKILGIIKNVQAKGKTSFTVKTCDLIITDKRALCVVLGSSTLVAGMTGQAIEEFQELWLMQIQLNC